MTTTASTAIATVTAVDRRAVMSDPFRCLCRDRRPLACQICMLIEPVLHDRMLRGAHLVEASYGPAVRRFLQQSGSVAASRAISSIASQNASRVSFDSVSVGSIINASGTIRGKYTVGGWKS